MKIFRDLGALGFTTRLSVSSRWFEDWRLSPPETWRGYCIRTFPLDAPAPESPRFTVAIAARTL
jgi:hypothetical protein